MKVGDLVRCRRRYSEHQWVGLVMEAETDDNGADGFWVEYFADRGSWKWYHAKTESHMVEVISESR